MTDDQTAKDHAKDYKRERELREIVRGLRRELDYLVAHNHNAGRVNVVQSAINQLSNDAAHIVRVWD